ncbi:MAG TPA: PQQ-binding-like beta-propeller repeat protein, partial [Opitutaceae bacterium]
PATDSAGNIAAIDSASVLLYLTSNNSTSWEDQLFQGSVSFNSPSFCADGSFNVTSTTGVYNISANKTINWSQPYPNTSGSSASTAIDVDGMVYVHSDDGVLHCYDSQGIEIWSTSVPGASMSSPAIGADGIIYIGSDNHFLYAINPIDGSIAWTFNAGGEIQASPALDAAGNIYFGTLNNQFYCLDHNGSQVYMISTGGEIYSSAAITPQGAVVFGSGDGKLYEISKAQNIAFTYSTTNGDGIYSSPSVLSDGSIVFGANDGQLYQISSAGALLHSWSTAAPILSSPVISQGRIIFGGVDHEVYTLQNNATLASSVWPTFRANSAHTGRVQPQQNAPVIHAVTPSQTYVDGAQVTLRVIVDGAGPMTYSWSFNGNNIGVISPALVFNMNSGLAGTYVLTVTNAYGSVTSTPIVVTEGAPLPPIDTGSGPGRIINLSARAYTGTGANTLIVGLIIGPGNGTKPILVRGVGPSLQARGVKTFIDDPALNLYSGSNVINSNDNWNTDPTVIPVSQQVGAASFTTSKDAALVAHLSSGGYTAHVINGSTSTGAGGVALAEFYDGSPTIDSSTPLLTNISARAHVGQGDQVLIVGFIIGGSSPVKVLIRGLGPQLTHQGVPNVIADPTMRLVNQADGSTIQTNDNWGDAPNLSDIQAAFTQVGATQLDTGSKDAVILTTLSPGGYTAVISGVNGSTGVGLAEVFEVQ